MTIDVQKFGSLAGVTGKKAPKLNDKGRGRNDLWSAEYINRRIVRGSSYDHTIASHSDTSATGAELDTLTDGSDAADIHIHDARYYTESATDTEIDTDIATHASIATAHHDNSKDITSDAVITDNIIVRGDGGARKVQDSGATIDDAGTISASAGFIFNTTRIINTASPYTILATDHVIFCDTDGGAIEVDLPAGVEGTHYKLINCGSSGNDLTVDPDGTEQLYSAGAGVASTLADGEVISIHYNATEGWF